MPIEPAPASTAEVRKGRRFRWRPAALIATVLVVALGIALGQWQTRRGDQKQAIANELAQREAEAPVALGAALQPAAALEYRRVRINGAFAQGWTVYLDNRPYNGVAGFYVLTPMRIDNSDVYVLVARGWTPRDSVDRSKLPALKTPSGSIALEGVVRLGPGHLMQLGQQAPLQPDAILQNLEVADLAAASKLRLQPFIVEQSRSSDTGDGLVRDWPQPSLGIEMHRGYAFQWYALSAMAVLFFVITGFRRGKK
ncbi:SURF1 family protein [Oxalobacteraceae bacterium CAVE-383]|nr:SURF1 family protein [Oxalobacteraceae bacterium CAVE-383]